MGGGRSRNLQPSPEKGRSPAVELYPRAGGERIVPRVRMVVVVIVVIVVVVVVVVVVVEPLLSYIYYCCCPLTVAVRWRLDETLVFFKIDALVRSFGGSPETVVCGCSSWGGLLALAKPSKTIGFYSVFDRWPPKTM